MRWYLLSSPVLRGADLMVAEPGIRDAVRQVILPLWNAWYFLSLYAGAAGTHGQFRADSTHVLDRYLLARTRQLVETVTSAMDVYDLYAASAAIRSHLDALTNWYIRRSRDRFWAGDQDAIDTLHTGLVVLCQVAAPLLPLLTEPIYQGLTGERSVHLTDWPAPDALPDDRELVAAMDRVREVCSTALGLRKANGVRVRQPLPSLTVAGAGAAALEPFRELIADEVNVKDVRLSDEVGRFADDLLQVVPAVAGPRLGPEVQRVIKAVRAGEWERRGDTVVAGGVALEPGEYSLRLVPKDADASSCLPAADGVVTLDLTVTPELATEGLARDLIRLVQQARRDAGLAVSDRVRLTVGLPGALRDRLRPLEGLVAGETLATSVAWGEPEPGTSLTLDDQPLSLAVTRT
jgi:isoleucyl-tRNA synthetase